MIRITIGTRTAVSTVAMIGALSVLSGCSSPTSSTSPTPSADGSAGHVSVKQETISVKKEYFDRGSSMSRQFAEQHNQSANTRWQFHCVPRFKFDIIDKKTSGTSVTVKLRITEALAYLSNSVTIFLPKQATPDVVSHEDGHVKICKKVYDENARPAAQAAAQALIGKEFEGTGPTLEDASQVALHRAAQQMGREFRSKTIDYLDRVSAYYDQLAPQHPESKNVDACVEAAFKADVAIQAKNPTPAASPHTQ